MSHGVQVKASTLQACVRVLYVQRESRSEQAESWWKSNLRNGSAASSGLDPGTGTTPTVVLLDSGKQQRHMLRVGARPSHIALRLTRLFVFVS